jgi:uncharacterized protein YcnI
MRSFIALALCAIPSIAFAHVELASGPGFANKSNIITFAVGHGCTDANSKKLDTVKIEVTIPAGVTSIRGIRSDFGPPTYTKNGTAVTKITWTKPTSEILESDDTYYTISLRAKLPDMPFTKLQWNVTLTCQEQGNPANTIVVPWDQPEGSTTGEPAPIQNLVPIRTTGWNKFTMTKALTQDEVALYLGDALIVWKGNAAYSGNANTAAQIEKTAGVVKLDGVAANDEIWVKY